MWRLGEKKKEKGENTTEGIWKEALKKQDNPVCKQYSGHIWTKWLSTVTIFSLFMQITYPDGESFPVYITI